MSSLAGSFNGNRGTHNASRTRQGGAHAPRCCAKCKTPGFGCAHTKCACHAAATAVAAVVFYDADGTKNTETFVLASLAEERREALADEGVFATVVTRNGDTH